VVEVEHKCIITSLVCNSGYWEGCRIAVFPRIRREFQSRRKFQSRRSESIHLLCFVSKKQKLKYRRIKE